MLYTISCILQGEIDAIEPIKIEETETVGELRAQIKEKREIELKDVPANKLRLYLINLPNDHNLEENLNQRFNTEQLQDWLRPTTPLNEVFSGALPPLEKVHILVKVSENSKWVVGCRLPVLLLFH
jgi:hypothetical protein